MKTIIIITIALLSVSNTFGQYQLKLATEVYRSISETQDALDKLTKVESIVRDIQAGNSPQVASYGSDWSKLANGYKKAAETIRNASLVTDFDASAYTVSASEMGNCFNRSSNMQKLQGYQQAINDAINSGIAEQQKINDYKDLIKKTRDALQYLIDINRQLATIPIYNEIFQWDWFALDQGVSPALGDLSSAVNAQERKLNRELEKLKSQKDNLAANIDLLRSSYCIISGSFTGTWSGILYKVIINRTGNTYSGNLVYSKGSRSNVSGMLNFNVQNDRFINFSVSNNVRHTIERYSGELTQDYNGINNLRCEGFPTFNVSLRK